MTESLLFDNNFSINKHFEPTAVENNDEILQSEFSFQHLDSSHLQGLDSGTEDDSEILYHIDNKYKTYNSAKRFFNSYASKKRVKSKRSYPDESISKHVLGETAMTRSLMRGQVMASSFMHISSNDMTSKDFFTLQFYNDSDSKVDAEKVPVCKGKSLKESIEIFLTKRDLSFNTHSVFLESSKTPLPLAFDTFPLGGNVLHVKANQEMQIDERIIMLMKGSEDKLPMGPRQKKSSEGADNSVHNGKTCTPINGKLNRKAGLFNSLKDMSRNISEMLAQHTMEDFENGDNNDSEFDNEIMLEDSWTDVITEVPELSQECKIQQEAIWELLMTERNYIRKIRVIIKVFQKYLINLQESGILTEVDSNKLFSNILEVYEANMEFWTKHLNSVVKEVRKTKQIIRPLQLLDSFSNFEELFKPYIRYCLEEANCVKYLKRLKRRNEFFVEYLLWCEENHQCMRLKLADLLVKPMQRITKYNLLLKVILNKTHNQEECSALESMITQVEQFVRKINTTLRLRHEEQKLNTVLDKLEQYLPIESATDEIEKALLEYCNFDLRARIPGLAVHEKRFLLFEGPMKIVEKQGRTDVHAFLFTDVLIMTKPKRGEKFRIVRQPYCLSKVVLHNLAGSILFIYLNEYGVMATAFTLLLNPNEQSKWLQAIEKAKTLYDKARKGNGSTSEFFDDDVTLPTLAGHSHSPQMSPLLFTRKISDADSNLHEVYKFTKEDISSHHFTGKSNEEVQEHSVKRSLSDPKPRALQWAYGKTFGNKPKNRPASFIGNHDQVTASWGLTERELSVSLPSSVLSRRSSGIGDSFRSVNSDTCVSSRYTGIQSFNNPSEISNSEIKKHLETSDHFENITALNQSHSLNDVSELSRSTDNGAKSFLVNNRAHQRLQFPNYSFHSDDKEESYLDSSIDSVKAFVLSRDDGININNSTENSGVEKPFALQPICINCSMHIKTTDSSTQYDDCVLKAPEILFSETGVQTECNYRNVTTQCGDFIHLNSRSGDSDIDVPRISDSYSKEKVNLISNFNSSTPLLDMLAALSPHDDDQIKKHKRGILKHAYSEANISHATIDHSEYLMHSRSHSDERHVLLKRNNSPQSNGPGMRALLTLSESLESSLQLSWEKEPEPKITTKTVVMKSNNNNAQISPSSNVKVFQDPSPYSVPKINSLDQSYNPTNTKVIMRNRSAGNHEISVRNTWNELDSLAALERIETLKHGVDHRRSSFDHHSKLDPNLSQSQANILDSSKKKSFKKEFFKRFSLSHKQDPSKKNFKEKIHKKKDKKQEKEDRKREKIFNSKASM